MIRKYFYTKWNNEIKTKSKNFLGYELPKYDFGGSSSYYVTEAKRRVYDSSHNTYQQYSYADEFSFRVVRFMVPPVALLELIMGCVNCGCAHYTTCCACPAGRFHCRFQAKGVCGIIPGV